MIKNIIYIIIDFVLLYKGIARNINGFKVRFPSKFARFFVLDYEKENFSFIKNNIKINDIVLDVGANIGLMSVLFSQLSGAKGKVYSFEPTPYTRKILKKVVNMNRNITFAPIEVLPYAISDKTDTITFNVRPNMVGVANSITFVPGTVPIEVSCIALDEFCIQNNIKVDFVKIDVEGAEYYALKGASNIFLNDKPKGTLGLHPWQIKNMGSSLAQIWDLLDSYNYSVLFEDQPLTRDWFCNQKELFDVFLIPKISLAITTN